MPDKEKKQSVLGKMQIAKTAWKAQHLSNLLFGIPLILAFFFFEKISIFSADYIALAYAAVYIFIYTPFYGLLPVFFSRKARNLLHDLENGRKAEKKEIFEAIKTVLDLPYNLSVIIFLSSISAFIVESVILSQWLTPDFMPKVVFFIFSGVLIGVVVSIIHLLLNYIYFENYFRASLGFLVSQLSEEERDELKFRKIPLFNKILFLIALSVTAAQLPVMNIFLSHTGFATPDLFLKMLGYVCVIIFLTIIFIFITVSNFTRNLVFPLQKIIYWAGVVASGGREQKINVLTNDEISEVIDYSRKMVGELETGRTVLEIKVQARTRELRELALSLDEQVKERTKELQKKIEELERFQRVSVGRELRMVELKKEIELLKKQMEEIFNKQDLKK